MDFILGRNNTYALSHNGNLLGHYRTELPPFTMRFEFTNDSYDPTSVSGWKAGSTWTKVEGVATNQWDWTCQNSNWDYAFENKFTGAGYVTPGNTVLIEANTSFVTSMRNLFAGCSNLVQVSWFDTANVVNMYALFSGCMNLSGTIPLYDTRNVTDMGSMFSECFHITEVPKYNTKKVTNMGYMFYSCDSITTVPLFDTSSVTSMQGMFHDCGSLISVPLFDTHNVVSISAMFENTYPLKSVPLFNTDSMVYVKRAFNHCYNVESGALALYNRLSAKLPPLEYENYQEAFRDCGRDTVTGAAELAQIPDDWK